MDYITLDGRLDEALWQNAKEYTGFRRLKSQGGQMAEAQTFVKILPLQDRVYFGFLCMEPDIQRTIAAQACHNMWNTDRIELFISPSGGTFDYYQFMMTFGGKTYCNYYSEGGNIQPDPYAPVWNSAVYVGEDFWSMEMEIPLTSLYMTGNASMSDTWLVGVIRARCEDLKDPRAVDTSCCELERGYTEFDHFLRVSGMPMRPEEDDIRIVSAELDIQTLDARGYCGQMLVKTINPAPAGFAFSSDCGESMEVVLQAENNAFTVPCCFDRLGRHSVSLALTRTSDGKVFQRHYPVTVTYEPIKLRFTLPEYRCNFYPGQDYSKVAGSVIAAKPVTLKLEGPGIETQIKTPNADGSFEFDTPNFEVGEAWLIATIEGEERKQKIRRLAPTGRMMSWVSGGNIIVDGKPVLPRNMFAPGYLGSKILAQRYATENFHETREVRRQNGWMRANVFLHQLGLSNAEAYQDVMPHEAVLREFDKQIEANKDYDFAYYYISDEPECSGFSPIYIKNVYEYIAERDPYHVIAMSTRAAERYSECADWFEVHPYISPENLPDGRRIYLRPMNTMGNFIDEIMKLERSDKCVGFLPTTFSYKFTSSYADYPTFDEIICHTWAAMIRGGKSLHPYAYHDMNDRPGVIEGARYIFSSFEALEKLVLLGKRTVLLQTKDAEAVLYDRGDEQMFVLVNFTQAPQTVTLDGISGTWHEFRHDRTITGNTFALKPLEVLIGTTVERGTDLPTYQETKALVDKLEYQRTHGGSLLFERENDIVVTSSGMSVSKYKLLDGVRENLAIEVPRTGERFFELDLTKVKPSFSKVAVSGWNLKGNVMLKVRVGGELVAPQLAEVKNEEFLVTFLLKDTVSPDGLQLEFTGDEAMQVFELEVF
ncbi:MAG: hypothetical protein E7421_00305 [Ruminococcaceae bacterium]|nr:hypothetical protein [Oscillospiraceae bacterium]